MSKRWKKIIELIFEGERFRGHGVDTEALREILTFQEIVSETAKEIWRRKHPERKRLIKNFEDLVTLRISEIKSGSAAIPIELPLVEGEQPGLWDEPLPEAKEAVENVYETIRAAGKGEPLPVSLPKKALIYYRDFGKSLRRNESLFISVRKRGKRRAELNLKILEKIEKYIPATYPDYFEVTGTVLAADVKKRDFVIYPDPKTPIPVNFTPEDELKVTTALRDHEKVKLKVEGWAEFTAYGEVKKIYEVKTIESSEEPTEYFKTEAQPIWETFLEIIEDMTEEEKEELPEDLASNIDLYLYGEEDK
jgi:hypothetical protein